MLCALRDVERKKTYLLIQIVSSLIQRTDCQVLLILLQLSNVIRLRSRALRDALCRLMTAYLILSTSLRFTALFKRTESQLGHTRSNSTKSGLTGTPRSGNWPSLHQVSSPMEAAGEPRAATPTTGTATTAR